MATIPEKMDDKGIRDLAEKIAATYMNGKACDSREFIETFLNVRDVAIGIIQERENKKTATYYDDMNNISFDYLNNEELPKSILR